jgi:hypothetical protein
MEEVLVAKAVSWKTELTSMMSSATSETDKQALAAFQSALMPYLDTPRLAANPTRKNPNGVNA